MKYRKLRTAWSVAWGIACVLLCVLWVRSYRSSDELRNASRWVTQLASFRGSVYWYCGPTFLGPERRWLLASRPIRYGGAADGYGPKPFALWPLPGSQQASVS